MFLNELEKRLQKLIIILNELPVVVEGKHDVNALMGIGVERENIYEYKKIKDLFLKNPEKVIILTDRDKRGKELQIKLSQELQSHNIGVDEQARKKFFSIFRVLTVEGIVKKHEEIEKVIKNGKSLHRHSKVHDKRKPSNRWDG